MSTIELKLPHKEFNLSGGDEFLVYVQNRLSQVSWQSGTFVYPCIAHRIPFSLINNIVTMYSSRFVKVSNFL
jgi:hypothetical protein